MKNAPQGNSRADLMQRIIDNFPGELIQRDQWVLWKLEQRAGSTTKIPYQANGEAASSTNSATWSDFQTSMIAFVHDSGFSGIGYVFSADDEYVGIDLDKCRDPATGVVEPWAAAILKEINTYTELSPSGRGFHLIGKGKLPAKGRRKGQVEMYDSARYFTVTGDHDGQSLRFPVDIQVPLLKLHATTFGKANKPSVKNVAANDAQMVPPTRTLEDQAVIGSILASADAETFKQFQAGNWATLGYPSQSEGDLALAGMLARHSGSNAQQIDRLFRSTGMWRDKWDEMRGADTYGNMTIAKAIDGGTADDAKSALVVKMNDRFALVQNGNQTRILDEGTGFRLLSKTDFELATANMYLPYTKTLASGIWLRSPLRRGYSGVVFSPGINRPDKYNLWEGFSVVPRPGDCSIFWELVFEAICAGSKPIYKYVRCYFAHMIQRPGERPGTAIVLRGKQGTGKNTVVDTFGSLVAKHYCQIIGVDQLTGRFNAHLRNVILLHANEATWGGNKSETGKLKAMITDATIPIEMKGVDLMHIDNYMRLVVSSNENWPVPVDADDRRFLILDVKPAYMQNTAFFAELHRQLDNGGREALMHALLAEDISNFSPRNKPASPFGADMKIRSADTVTRWLYDLLSGNAWSRHGSMVVFTQTRTPTQIGKADFFDDYLQWFRTSQERFPMSRDQFFKRAKELLGSSMTEVRPAGKPGQARARELILSSIEACRGEFGIAAGIAGAMVWDPI